MALLKNVIYKLCAEKNIYNMCKEDFALNNPQWLMCHKTQPNQTNQNQLE